MKKLMMTLALATVLLSCSKDKGDCYWTDNSGTDWDHYPSAAEKQAFEQNCNCAMVLTKHCD
jgi:hypothetical protein